MSSRFSRLSALFINYSIKRAKTDSHTPLLIDKAAAIMTGEGVEVGQLLHSCR
jgi:hypothetical protein